jgi:hypothetical protein
MATFSNNFGAKKGKKGQNEYYCELCHFKCCKKYSWERHITTMKHELSTNSNENATQKEQKGQFICDKCNKEYNDRTGLWRHKKKCIGKLVHEDSPCNNNNNSSIENEILCDKELIMTLVKQNAELLEIIKNGTTTNIINNNVNSNNKTFNLQVFLNETCKDAMNISEFIESVKLQVSDLENVGKVGYIEGISNIIIKNLQALEVEKRPVHCTDQKREVMYVKEDNIWEKEDEGNKRLRKLVRAIAHKNICMLKAFRDKYPDCEQYDSKKGSQYNKLVIEAMGGKGDNDYEKNTKIIKKIAKAVGIDKS